MQTAQKTITSRQKQVLSLVSMGFTYRQVADQLAISESTVKFHINEIRKRFHLKNRAHVLTYYLTACRDPGT